MVALVDVNVLVALMHSQHLHSKAAVTWLEKQSQSKSVAVCRIVQMGCLRILTNNAWLKSEVKSALEFWDGFDLLMSDDRFVKIAEPDNFEQAWRTLTSALPKGQIAETDVYLAAFALAAGVQIVTFDKGFRRFPNVDVEIIHND